MGQHGQVGRIFPTIGKASLDDPESRIEPDSSDPSRFASRGSRWQIPRGVAKGNWDYVRANQIATQYDEFLAGDPLTKVDWQIIDRYLPPLETGENLQSGDSQSQAPLVADFGCGTGRTLAPLLQRGYRGLAVDLSIPMLAQFAKKTDFEALGTSLQSGQLTLVNANLCELDGLKDDSVDHSICMFSTLGMIAGSGNRASFLAHARRILKPGGLFILHAHNVWFQLGSRGGIKWALGSAWSQLRGDCEFGDRLADYRGLRNLYIHSFRRNELQRALVDNGFTDLKWYGVGPGATEVLENFPAGSSMRLVGWIVVCR